MKNCRILIVLFTLLVAFSCGHHQSPVDNQLRLIDSLADVNPLHADSLLSSILPTNDSLSLQKQRHATPLHAWKDWRVGLLLRIKVDDKLYRPVTHYRDTVLQLINYFEQHPKVLSSVLGSTGPALPYLYAGRIFADLGDAPQALDYYQRALDAMPTYREGEPRCTTKQRGLLHSFIAETFYFQRLYNEAVSSLHEANHYATLANDTLDQIFNYRDIAEEYNKLNKKDSSLLSYQIALNLARQSHNINMCNDVMAQMARLYISFGNYENAKKCILPALHQIDSADISSTYSIASRIYKHEGKRDSALFCYNKLLVFGNIYGKRNAHRELSELALQHNDLHAATEHFHQYKFLDDSIRARDNAEVIARMHAAYNYQKYKEQAAELKLSNAKKNSEISFIILFSIIIVFVALVFFYNIVKKHKLANKRLMEINAKLKEQSKLGNSGELLEELACLKKEMTVLTLQLEKTDKEQLSMRKKLEEQISKLSDEKIALEHAFFRASNRQKSQEEAILSFSETSVYIYFAQTAKDKKVVSLEKWNEFILSAETYYFPDFKNNLINICRVSEQEYRMCLLFKSGFSKADIAKLLLIDRSAVGHAFVRMYTRVTHHKGVVADWEKILLVL